MLPFELRPSNGRERLSLSTHLPFSTYVIIAYHGNALVSGAYVPPTKLLYNVFVTTACLQNLLRFLYFPSDSNVEGIR